MAVTLTERPYEVAFSRNPVIYKFRTDTALNTAGLRIDVRLFHREFAGNTFLQIVDVSLVPDSTGSVQVDFQKILDSLLEYQLPTIKSASSEKAYSQVGQFYVDYREATTAAPSPSWTSDLNKSRIVVKGGLPYQQWQGPNFFIKQSGNLTWQKHGRYIGHKELSWMTYLHLGANNQEGLNAKVNVWYTDGTNTENAVVIPLPVTAAPRYSIFRIPVGYQLRLDKLNEEKTIWYYTVRIAGTTTDLTPEYRYEIDYRNTYSKFTMYFFNSLGGFDSVRLLGNTSKEAKYDQTVAEKTLTDKYYLTTEVAAQSYVTQKIEQIVYKSSIGLVDDGDIVDRARELFLSKSVSIIRFNRWNPVILLNNSIDFGSDADPVKDLPVEWTPGYTNESYSPDIRIGDLPSCPIVTNLAVSEGNITWTGHDQSVQYVIEVWDVFQTSITQVIYTTSTSYNIGTIVAGFVRVKADCGFNQSPFTEFVTL